jgi:hypothetical protein
MLTCLWLEENALQECIQCAITHVGGARLRQAPAESQCERATPDIYPALRLAGDSGAAPESPPSPHLGARVLVQDVIGYAPGGDARRRLARRRGRWGRVRLTLKAMPTIAISRKPKGPRRAALMEPPHLGAEVSEPSPLPPPTYTCTHSHTQTQTQQP